ESIRIHLGKLSPSRCHKLEFWTGCEAATACASVPRTLKVLFLRSSFTMRPVVAIEICSGSGENRSAALTEAVKNKTAAMESILIMDEDYTPGARANKRRPSGLTTLYLPTG